LLALAACRGGVDLEPPPVGAGGGATGTSAAVPCPSPVRHSFEGTPWISARRLGASPAGGFTLVGAFSGTLDLGTEQPLGPDGGTFLAHLDVTGQPTSSKLLGAYRIVDAAFDAAGNIVVAAQVFGPFDFGAGPVGQAGANLDILELDPEGALLWSRGFSVAGVGELDVGRVSVDAAGGVVVSGTIAGTVDFGDGPLPGPSPGTGLACFALRLGPQGDLVYGRQLGTGAACVAGAAAVGTAGDAVYFGIFSPTELGAAGTLTLGDATLTTPTWSTLAVRLDPAGDVVWADAYPMVDVTDAVMAPDGAAVIAGSYNSVDAVLVDQPLPADGNTFVAALDPAGKLRWSYPFDGIPTDSVVLGPGSDVVFGGGGSIVRLDPVQASLCSSADDQALLGGSGGTVAVDAAGNLLEATSSSAYDAASNDLTVLALPR
jgi:hypothetical protein